MWRSLLGLVVVAFTACGGSSVSASSHVFNDTWLWDGTDWAQVHAATAPSPRTEPAFGYDAETHDVVLFGGRTTTDFSFLNDTWTWDGTVWTLQHPRHSPGGRSNAAFTYDPAASAMILVGGYTQRPNATLVNSLDEVWKWDGYDWTLIGHATQQVVLSGAGRAGYDLRSKQVVVVTDTVTLAWDGTTWRLYTNPHNWAGVDVMYADPASGAVIVMAYFDNPDSSLTYRLETWDGVAWTMNSTVPLPTTMSEGWLDVAGAAYDSKRRLVTTLGGGCTGRPSIDTLTFDGAAWSMQHPRHSPEGRTNAYMVFDPDHSVVVMFGGDADSPVGC
jgi:hypothetical protein